MYADREEAGRKTSIKERLNGSSVVDSGSRRLITGKRERQDDDKWEHDLYEYDEPQVSNRRVGSKDLRLKLQKKNMEQATPKVRGSLSGGKRDLREKLSGTVYSPPGDTDLPKPKPVLEGNKSARNSVIVGALVSEVKKVASLVSKKKTQQKAESVDGFLQSLGLEKYSITFQAEEVDMTTLIHMTDDDLKAMGVPMVS
ncbi:unnamed protein product [Ilex paraguariensis]|uniref:SAM domain-containing protein n=1 Tax=Ilex paraguariensis TaxID=185542 RepID=A0ABC8T1Z3_9AQUA